MLAECNHPLLKPETALKPKTVALLGEVDIAPALDLLEKLPASYWRTQNQSKQNNYPVFHSTDHIVMRFVDSNEDPRSFTTHLSWNLFGAVLLPVMSAVSAYLDITNPVYPKAMLARLKAQSVIDPHIDHGSSHALVHKIHVPLVSHADVEFLVGGTSSCLRPGYAYEVNNLIEHGASNATSNDRIHFVFEVFDGLTA